MKTDYLVIGAGIVGAATAYALSLRYPGKSIVILDKEASFGLHQSSHNSGVIHAGIYYQPGSFKADLCRKGLSSTYRFCQEHGIAHKNTGKLLVATSPEEDKNLQALAARAQTNGVTTSLISRSELLELEPNISGVSALRVSETGIVDYREITQKLLSLSAATAVFGREVLEIAETARKVSVITHQEHYEAEKLIVCGGLQADSLARIAGLQTDCTIVPFRGDFYLLVDAFKTKFKHLIYPVPDPALPFLGVHITSHIDGNVSVGPSAMLAFAREAYTKFGFNLTDTFETLANRGFWRLMVRYPKASVKELSMALSIQRYAQAAQKYCPAISARDFKQHRCGIRAQAVNAKGVLIHDFLFEKTPRMLHVLNAPSPAATAALPIGEHIVDML